MQRLKSKIRFFGNCTTFVKRAFLISPGSRFSLNEFSATIILNLGVSIVLFPLQVQNDFPEYHTNQSDIDISIVYG